MAAAVAVVAAAASTFGKGFWANRVVPDWGVVKLGGKAEGTMRLLMNNIRRVKKDGSGGTDVVLYAQATTAMGDAEVDLLGLVDTGVEDGSAPGQALLWSAGKLRMEMARHWGGTAMLWQHSEGAKGARSKAAKNGCALAVSERWKGFGGRKYPDESGHGRFTVRELVGTNGTSVAVVVMYLPSRGEGGAWSQQEGRMKNLKGQLRLKAKKKGVGLTLSESRRC